MFGLGAVGDVRAVGHIDDESHIGLERVSSHGGPIESVFFLHGGDSSDAGFGWLGDQLAQGLAGRPDTDAIVASAGCHAVVLQVLEAVGVGDGVTHPHEFFRLGLGASADVDIHLVELGHLFAVVRLLQVDGERASHPPNGALRPVHVDPLAAEECAVDAADALDKEKALLVDMGGHEAEFVDVAGQNDVRFMFRIPEAGERIAIGIGGEMVTVRFDVVGPDPLGPGLEPGGGRRGDEIFEELEGCLFHPGTMQSMKRRGKTSTPESPSGSILARMTFTRATLRELRPTLRLAAPITAGQVGQMLMGVADTIMIGHVGTLALAACAFANNLLIVIAVTGYGVLTAVSIRVSHAHGAGVAPAMARALHGGLGLSVIMGLLGATLLHFIYPAFHFLGQAPGVVEEAQNYMLIVGWSLIPAWLLSSARSYLEAQSRPWPAFWIMFGGVILNVVLNYVLIYGKLGAPAMGLTGAGWATLISRVVTVGGLLWFVWAGRSRPSERCGFDREWWRDQWALFRLGLPAGLQLLSEVGAFAVAALLIGRLGAVPLAAHQIAITCASTTFMVPLGIAIASTVRIAQAMGAGRIDLLRPIAAGSWAIGLVFMALFAALFLIFNTPIAAAFVREPDVIKLAASLLVIAGIFQLVDGVQVVGSGLLRGLRDTTGPMLITVTAYWLVALPLGTWLALVAGDGAPGMWLGLALGLLVAAGLLVRRFFVKTLPYVGAQQEQ